MQKPVFRFDRFRLDTQARELFEDGQRVVLPLSTIDCLIYLIRHRDRPVGRDELAAAVWERIDVSEVSVSHAIMRLRRRLGDTGSDQRIIRTVPRLGYRWVGEGTIEEAPVAEAGSTAADATPAPREPEPAAAAGNSGARWLGALRYRLIAGAVGVAALAALGVGVLRWTGLAPVPREPGPAPVPALVLPAEISAPAQWDWLELGLMDLVASQLRRGDLATAPSETVVALLERNPGLRPVEALRPLAADLQIQPSGTLTRGQWTIRLEARRPRGTLVVESHAPDAIRAARMASDELLIKLGHAPPAENTSDATLVRETLRQRVNAAVLSGQLAVARALIEEATPALQNQPEIALSQASVEFFSGNYEAAAQRIDSLLERLPADRFAELRGRALITLGATRYRQGQFENASAAYAEAIRLLAEGSQPISLAKAYVGRGGIASQHMDLEAAAADYGRARALYEFGNDVFGVAVVDLNLGMNAIQRGQPAIALPILRGASERLRELGADDAWAASMASTIEVELQLLDFDGALATSERLQDAGAQTGNQRQRWELVLSRARALAANGRLSEADSELSRIREASEAQADAAVRLQASGLLAENAFARADFAAAIRLADAAATPELAKRAPGDYARVALVRIRALQALGRQVQSGAEQTHLASWAASARDQAARIQAELGAAYQFQAEGRAEDARQRFREVMAQTEARGIPDEIVAAGSALVPLLIDADRLEEASEVLRQLAPWVARDMRVAWSSGLLEAARGHSEEARTAFARARQLAGERALPEPTRSHEATRRGTD